MLTDKDIERMREWRKEVTEKRKRSIVLHVESVTKHPLTGEEIADTALHEVASVVTERSSRTASEVVFQGGAEVREGDIWFSVDIDELETIPLTSTDDFDSVAYVTDLDREYKVVAWDRKGIGETNRLEFVGKVVT